MDKYNCERCGACCRNIDKSIYFAALDKGNGVCINLDENTNLCKIYEQRPLLCNINEAYEVYFKKIMSLDEYYTENRRACEYLRSLKNKKSEKE